MLTLLTGIAFYYATANAHPELTVNTAALQDIDPYDILQPNESLVANGQQITNTTHLPIKVEYCPGKGERCRVTVTIKGVSVTYEEEKSPDKNPIEVKW